MRLTKLLAGIPGFTGISLNFQLGLVCVLILLLIDSPARAATNDEVDSALLKTDTEVDRAEPDE